MNYLLDTNVLLFMLGAPDDLSEKAKGIILTEDRLFVSVASLWEIAIKQSLGKLSISLSIPDLAEQCRLRDIRLIPISEEVLERIKSLPFLHKDPFDRLLIALAQTENMTIVTKDDTIPKYSVQTVW